MSEWTEATRTARPSSRLMDIALHASSRVTMLYVSPLKLIAW